MRGTLIAVAAAAVIAGATPAWSAGAPPAGGGRIYGDAQRGKAYVERSCTTCHVAGASGTDAAPALASLKKNPKKTDAYIRGFLAAPHKPMPPMALSTQDIEDIIAYLLGRHNGLIILNNVRKNVEST
jgi:mono/diheme cytochrome c family protein